MIYFTADTHFGHNNIIKYSKRPFNSVNEMDEMLLKNYNNIIKDEDIVYFIGDFCLRPSNHILYYQSLIEKMKGEKHLILGNHDKLKPFIYVEMGFQSVHTSLEVNINGSKLILNHDPSIHCMFDDKTIILCGHVHNLFIKQKNVINVGVDVCDYKPIDIRRILSIFYLD